MHNVQITLAVESLPGKNERFKFSAVVGAVADSRHRIGEYETGNAKYDDYADALFVICQNIAAPP